MPSLWPASVWNSTGALGVEMSHERDTDTSPREETQRGKQHFPLSHKNCVLGSISAVLDSSQLPSGSQREY